MGSFSTLENSVSASRRWNVGVHRLEVVVRLPRREVRVRLSERTTLVPGQDRLPLPRDRLEISAVLAVGAWPSNQAKHPRHLEREVVVWVKSVDTHGGIKGRMPVPRRVCRPRRVIDPHLGSEAQWNPPESRRASPVEYARPLRAYRRVLLRGGGRVVSRPKAAEPSGHPPVIHQEPILAGAVLWSCRGRSLVEADEFAGPGVGRVPDRQCGTQEDRRSSRAAGGSHRWRGGSGVALSGSEPAWRMSRGHAGRMGFNDGAITMVETGRGQR